MVAFWFKNASRANMRLLKSVQSDCTKGLYAKASDKRHTFCTPQGYGEAIRKIGFNLLIFKLH
jgi:hypothetical protein